MFLSRFGVKRYKCLGEIDIPLTPIHVLIGENDAGKTSLLEAIAALHASSEKQLSNVFPTPWTGGELLLHGSAHNNVELRGEWSASAGEKGAPSYAQLAYKLAVEFAPAGQECVCVEEAFESHEERRDLSFPDRQRQATTMLAVWKKQRSGVPGDLIAYLDALSNVVKPAPLYCLDPKAMAVPAAIDTERKFRLDVDGFGLPTILMDILGYDAALFVQLRDKFCELFPHIKSVRVLSEQGVLRKQEQGTTRSVHRGVGSGIYFESHNGQTVRAQLASDGAILLLGFLALAHLPDPPNLLLIEEPENGIYPKRLGQVITMLKEMVHRTDSARFPQIILSTHSPYVLSFFEPEEVTFLSRPKDGPDAPVRARPLRDAPNIRERMAEDQFYLGELWYNLTEEELFGD